MTEQELVALHRDSMNNRGHLSGRCGCFHCLSTFMADRVTEWVDDGATALCPVCGIDAVVGTVTGDTLDQMHRRWFDAAPTAPGQPPGNTEVPANHRL